MEKKPNALNRRPSKDRCNIDIKLSADRADCVEYLANLYAVSKFQALIKAIEYDLALAAKGRYLDFTKLKNISFPEGIKAFDNRRTKSLQGSCSVDLHDDIFKRLSEYRQRLHMDRVPKLSYYCGMTAIALALKAETGAEYLLPQRDPNSHELFIAALEEHRQTLEELISLYHAEQISEPHALTSLLQSIASVSESI